MSETCINELGVERAALMAETTADTTLATVTGEQLAAEDHSIATCVPKLEAMGPVNMMALEEYKETPSGTHSWKLSART